MTPVEINLAGKCLGLRFFQYYGLTIFQFFFLGFPHEGSFLISLESHHSESKSLQGICKVTPQGCQQFPQLGVGPGHGLQTACVEAEAHWRSLKNLRFRPATLEGINISHLGKRKIIFKMPFFGDMLVSWRVFPTKAGSFQDGRKWLITMVSI